MKKKLYLYLSGGLGNQLFQYSFARNMAIKNNAQLILDQFTGFIDDFRFKRSFSLRVKKKNIKIKKYIFFFFCFRVLKKLFNLKKIKYIFLNYCVINEYVNHKYFHPNIKKINPKKNLFVMGLFQSEKYFIENKSIIVNELIPKKPSNKIFETIKKKITSNSIAIGVRMHEGLPIDLQHTAGGICSSEFYSKALSLAKKKIKNAELFFFSSKKKYIEDIVNHLGLKKKFRITFVTPEDGYADANDNLWLMSNFKNLIISNSTLYWWAAYLSEFKSKKNLIICSKKFPNIDTVPERWIKL